jgi:hypothetical protein
MQQVDLWYLSRATGVVALVLLTATTFLGVLVAGRAKSKLPSFARADAHRYISAVTVAFVAGSPYANKDFLTLSSPRRHRKHAPA